MVCESLEWMLSINILKELTVNLKIVIKRWVIAQSYQRWLLYNIRVINYKKYFKIKVKAMENQLILLIILK